MLKKEFDESSIKILLLKSKKKKIHYFDCLPLVPALEIKKITCQLTQKNIIIWKRLVKITCPMTIDKYSSQSTNANLKFTGPDQ